MKTKRELGYGLENYVADCFINAGYDKARPSKGSGNRGELGDVAGQDLFVVEAKKRTTKNITIKSDVWKKLCNEIPLHSKRMPMYVLENSEKQFWCVLQPKDFFTVLEGYLKYEESKNNKVSESKRTKSKCSCCNEGNK